jgi:hypothetical protein
MVADSEAFRVSKSKEPGKNLVHQSEVVWAGTQAGQRPSQRRHSLCVLFELKVGQKRARKRAMAPRSGSALTVTD